MINGLYGICHSNRTKDDHWGKNCFNSSFPVAIASYMLDKNIPAIYVSLINNNGNLQVSTSEISLREVFNCGNRSLEDLYFAFESIYVPYKQYSFDPIDGIDLIIKDTNGEYLTPLEVKLTVLPTSATSKLPESKWGSEIVIRSATTSYCAFGMFDAVKEDCANVREIFETPCADIQTWNNDYEVGNKIPTLYSALNTFQMAYLNRQRPLVMQVLWKTKGESPLLDERAFDIVVWSDYAFSRLTIDNSSKPSNKITRYTRSTARFARCLWELSKSKKIRHRDIYRQMSFNLQTDKEFAISGQKWRTYVVTDRLQNMALHKDVLKKIISSDELEKLRPERRFDQTLYFTVREQE